VKNDKAARVLIVLGCIVLFANAALHCIAGYLHLSQALGPSNLPASLKPGLESVFFLAGWDWIAIAIIVLIAAFSGAQARKAILIFCAVALFVSAGIVFHFLGWFIADETLAAAALLILFGALLLN
jgi:hypothetical protein